MRCKHGTYIGTPQGADHLCGQCEDGDTTRVAAENGATCEVCYVPLVTTNLDEPEHRCEAHPMV